jgi:hypothetical protein
VRELLRHRTMHLLGLLAVLPLVAMDPGLVVLLYDVELLALIGSVGVAMLRGDARVLWLQVRHSGFVTEVRAAAAYTRRHPHTLLEC